MTLNQFIRISKALSDPQRVRALMSLRNGELCLCQIIELLSLAPSTISKHMSILKMAGLVTSRKDSRWVYYCIPEFVDRDNDIRDLVTKAITLLEHDDEICRDDKALTQIAGERLARVCNSELAGRQ